MTTRVVVDLREPATGLPVGVDWPDDLLFPETAARPPELSRFLRPIVTRCYPAREAWPEWVRLVISDGHRGFH